MNSFIKINFFFLFIFSFSITSGFTIEEIRTSYGKALENSKIADQLLQSLNNVTVNEPLFLAYKGATEALIAKHAFNPYKKYEYLDKSMKTLAQAIAKDPLNPEIRFLRFTIQYYVPSFLGYTKNLDEDKTAIVKNFYGLKKIYNPDMVKGAGDLLISSGKCTPSEVEQIKAML
ncbi:MAG: hypothetical protein LH473_09140 [Chitinophagales bacterium]|nr:hypothetical protein [Chitinophagales bacterium]